MNIFRGFLKGQSNWPAMSTILTTWSDHLRKSFYIEKRFSSTCFFLPVKTIIYLLLKLLRDPCILNLGISKVRSWFYFQRSLCREDNSASNDVHFLWESWLEGEHWFYGFVSIAVYSFHISLLCWVKSMFLKLHRFNCVEIFHLSTNQGRDILLLFTGFQSAWSSHRFTEVMFSFQNFFPIQSVNWPHVNDCSSY